MEIQIISKGSSCKIFHEGKSGMLQKINLFNVMGRYDVIILNEEDFVTVEGERYNCMLPVFAQSSEYEMVTQLNSLFEGLDGTFESAAKNVYIEKVYQFVNISNNTFF